MSNNIIGNPNEKIPMTPESESTSVVSAVSYELEKIRAKGGTDADIDTYLKIINKNMPKNLEYKADYYDSATGIGGCAFLDKNTGQMVVGYPGTNVNADGIKDIMTDASLATGNYTHASSAVKFYDQMAKDGYPIVLTGHSLGGNVAALVAIITNNPMAVTYNGAPLSASSVTDFLAGLSPDLVSQFMKLVSDNNLKELQQLIDNYSGTIIRFVSENDPLNGGADSINSLYIGTGYHIYNKNGHGMHEFFDEDVQSYLTKIIDMERSKIIYANVGVDMDGDGSVDVIRSARQLIVKDLLGNPGDNFAGNGKKVQINPENLINLSINMQMMANDDISWIDNNVTKCEDKNASIQGSFESRLNTLNESVVSSLEESGLGTLLQGIDDSFGEIKNQKSTLKTLESFSSYDVTRKFDSLGESGKRKWFKGGFEWSFSDVNSFGKDLKSLMTASQILLHNIETTGEFEYYDQATGGTKIYTYSTISEISKAFVNITNALEPKIKKAFKGIGLRNGKNDGIAEALVEVFSVEHKNTSELNQALNNISELTASIATNYKERDQWIQKSIDSGNMLGSPDAVHVPKTYKAYLEESDIFDDVKDVLQAFDQQVEERSQKLSKQISSDFSNILTEFESKAKVVSEGMNQFKKMVNKISEEGEKEITYEKNVMKSVINEDAVEKNKSGKKDNPGYVDLPIYTTTLVTETGSSGKLNTHYPPGVLDAINSAKTNILPLLDIFNAVLNTCQLFKDGVNSMDSYLKDVVEKGVYKALELSEIVSVQMLSSEVLNRMIQELGNLNNSFTEENLGAAIENLSVQVVSVKKLLSYFNEMIQNCFGTQTESSSESSDKSKTKNSDKSTTKQGNSYSRKF